MFTGFPQNAGAAEFFEGLRYLYGKDREKDLNKAFSWFLESANLGNASAQFCLAYFYEHGSGTEKDPKKAFYWYIEAANQGRADALNNIGYCYEHGIGTEIDLKKAFCCYLKAANQGEATGQFNVGSCYNDGTGTEIDLKKAFYWHLQAANQGRVDAQFKVACCYEIGKGTEEDSNKALEWFQKSANQGCIKSKLWIEKKISCKPNIIFDEAATNHNFTIPKIFPAPADQIKDYCGSAAFAAACNYCHLLPFPLYASNYEKQMAGQTLEKINEDVVLEQLNHTRFPSTGPQYSIYSFQDLAQHYKLKNCTAVILPENCTEEEYRNTICEALSDNYVLILPVDCVDEMPQIDNGKSLHWVLAFAKLDNKRIAVTQHGLYCKWSILAIHESNNNVPQENPNEKNGSLKDFRFSLFKMKKQDNLEMINSKKRALEPNLNKENNKRQRLEIAS